MTSVLFVVSAARMWELTGGAHHPTGYWAEELATPHRIFSKAGWSIDIATPGGVAPTAERSSLGIAGGMPAHRRRVTAYLDAIAADLAHPIPLDRVDETHYDLVFYPGGHGAMVDLAFDETSGSLLTRRLRSGNPLALLGHGVAAILAAKNPHNPRAPSPFADYQVTGVSTLEEKLSPFSRKIPWYLEDRLAEISVYITRRASRFDHSSCRIATCTLGRIRRPAKPSPTACSTISANNVPPPGDPTKHSEPDTP